MVVILPMLQTTTPNKLPKFTPPASWLRGTRLSARPLARRYGYIGHGKI